MKSIEITRERKSLIIFLLALMVGFLYMMDAFLIPMILAAIITILVYPAYLRLTTLLSQRFRLSAFITTLLVFFILILPSTLIVTILIEQLYTFVTALNLKDTFSSFFSADFYTTYVAPYVADFESRFQIKIDILGMLSQFGKHVAKYFYSYSPSVLLGTANFVFNFFIMMVGIYFLLLEGPSLLKLFLEISPLRLTHEKRLFRRLKTTIDASIYGYLVTALIQGLIASIVFAIVGLKAYVVLGTLTFFMSMVPVVGAAGVWVPVCVWLFFQSQTWQGVVVLITGAAIISMIDNFLKPIIIEGKTKIHPLLIFFSLFGGIKLFGPLGILFGPVITALLIATITIYREEFVK